MKTITMCFVCFLISNSFSQWIPSTNTLYTNTDSVGIGISDPEAKLDVREYNYGEGTKGIYSFRNGTSGATNGGAGWCEYQVDAGIRAYSYWGNEYSAGIASFSYLDYNNSTAFVAGNQNGSSTALLGYRDINGEYWSGYFNGNVNTTGEFEVNPNEGTHIIMESFSNGQSVNGFPMLRLWDDENNIGDNPTIEFGKNMGV